jgi:hypothetical protein
MTTLFFQQIKYDQSQGPDGEFFIGDRFVTRAVVACDLSRGGKAFDDGYRAVVFITENDTLQSPLARGRHKVFFKGHEEAVAFARGEVSHHEYVGEPIGSMA